MCKKCGNSGCDGCNGGGSANLANAMAQLAIQQDILDNLTDSLGVFLNGHPIVLFDQVDDVALFNLSTGWGTGYLKNWAICNGSQYLNPVTNKFITPPNMTDRVPVQAGGTYAIDAVVGNDTIVLTVPQLPAHNHTITDPGHIHVVTDPGHLHTVNDPGHVHAGTSAPHTHVLTVDANLAFTMQVPDPTGTIPTGTLTNAGYVWDGTSYSAGPAGGVHTHTGSADASSAAVTIAAAFTGIQTLAAFTGITNVANTTGITVDNTGAGAAVDVRQKSYAVFFAMKIY